ncbi:MAG: DNA repair protein RadC [Proteobacteria bacterium]|nr:DNA repair protein RadC [Pseudomonadota bacterium]
MEKRARSGSDGQPAPPAGDPAEAPSSAAADHLGHREWLRRRFLAGGPDALADYELLELILFGANPRGDTKPLAKKLLDEFKGDFAEVIAADPERLKRVKGMGDVALVTLKAIHAAAARLARTRLGDRPVIGSWTQLIDYCTVQLAREPVEQFRVLFLDRKNVLIADEKQNRGTVDHTPVYPREIAKRALELNASALIIVHNHPSGDPTPSQADIAMTREIQRAVAAIGVTLHDHLVIGRAGHASFKSLGLL